MHKACYIPGGEIETGCVGSIQPRLVTRSSDGLGSPAVQNATAGDAVHIHTFE